jgi:FKBP-type peptidyl-prolyl cis-trans isomerase FklB
MKKLSFVVALSSATVVLASLFSCSGQAQAPKANLKTDVDSLSYAVGVSIGNSQSQLGQYLAQEVDSAYLADFVKGFNEGFKLNKSDKKVSARMLGLQVGQQFGNETEGMAQYFFAGDSTKKISKDNFAAGVISAVLGKKLLMNPDSVQLFITTFQSSFFAKQHSEDKANNVAFLEENKSKEGVITLPSGLQYKVISEGKGPHPTAEDVVKVEYVGTTIDGKEFDSTTGQGKPAEFSLSGVIPGWTEGIQLMSVGSKYTFYIPYELAYGEQGRQGSIPPFATLIFEVTLLDIVTSK